MFTAEQCRRLAEECEQDAARASSLKLREELLAVARMWRDLAEFKQQMASIEKAA
jgi:hypothetical protein